MTLIPTTIGALLSAIGIAGMDRLVRFNVLAMSGRAVEAAGDVDTLLLDKTGTITLGNRQAAEFIPLPGVSERELADAAQLASLSDETPEGRSIVVLAKERTASASATWPARRALHPVHRADAHQRHRHRRRADPQRRGRRRGQLHPAGQRQPEHAGASASSNAGGDDREDRRHAAGGCPRWQAARARSPEGHREGRHPRALRGTSRAWASAP